jgi:hypothetical protein
MVSIVGLCLSYRRSLSKGGGGGAVFEQPRSWVFDQGRDAVFDQGRGRGLRAGAGTGR